MEFPSQEISFGDFGNLEQEDEVYQILYGSRQPEGGRVEVAPLLLPQSPQPAMPSSYGTPQPQYQVVGPPPVAGYGPPPVTSYGAPQPPQTAMPSSYGPPQPQYQSSTPAYRSAPGYNEPPQGVYGRSKPHGGFYPPPQQPTPGYNQGYPQSVQSYGASAPPPSGGSYCAPPPHQQGGYGSPSPQPGSYGLPTSQPGSYGPPTSQPGSYGQPTSQPGGYGQPTGQPQSYGQQQHPPSYLYGSQQPHRPSQPAGAANAFDQKNIQCIPKPMTQWPSNQILDPSMVLAINGYQATSVNLNKQPRTPFGNLNRNNRNVRQNNRLGIQDTGHLDNRPSHDRQPQSHRTSPPKRDNQPFLGHHSYISLSQQALHNKANQSHMSPMDNNNTLAGRQLEISKRYKSRRKPPLNDGPTVVSKQTLEDFNQKTPGQMQSTSLLEDDKVPIEIKLMADKKYVPLYLKLLESGSEKKREIRLVILGKKGSGKTSFLKRLLREDIDTIRMVTSTDGIAIHRTRCNVNSGDGKWNKFDGINEETTRLLKPFEETIKIKVTERTESSAAAAVPKTPENNKLQTIFDESKDLKTASQQPKIVDAFVATPIQLTETQFKSPVTTESPDQLPSLRSEQASRDIDKMLESVVDLSDKDEYGTLLLWDFAGDEEFYHTHQTFLSPDAIYIVLTKLNEADDIYAQEMFQLWMSSIHCYCRLEEQTNKAESNSATMHERIRDTVDLLDPPVVLVGSHKDKVKPSEEEEETEDACRKRLNSYTKKVSDVACRHIRKEYFISNTEDNDSEFYQIRLDILNLAKSRRSWNSDYPLKFIQVEKSLKEKKKELKIPILSLDDIKKISTETAKPLNNEELMLYLKYHHEIRALVYFEDLPDYIILDTQWLSDVFKCVVTAKKFQSSIRRHMNKRKWADFHERGILHTEVLEHIFKDNPNVFEYQNHILNVMEKFDIIICPKISEGDFAFNKKPCYYVPCMIKKELKCDIYEMFNMTENKCSKSNWLCFKFRFLPPHLSNHLIASLCRKYEVAEVGISNQTERQFALFKGTTVFELEKTTKLRKLLLVTFPNFILVQILEFGKNAIIQRDLYKHIKDLVKDEINNIINRRFKMTNVNYKKKWECGLTKPGSVTGSNDFSEEQITEYHCKTCRNVHKCNNEWSDIQNEMLSSSTNSEDTPETNSKTENTRKPFTLTTKVRCQALCDMRTVSNVSEESSRAGSLTQFTNEEYNFAKMGMIVLNILADVLYDLLRQDQPNLRSRSNCDLTFLYSEHRKLNKHIPSNSWGGQWQRIQNTDILIGDDIERMRLTRNDMQHASSFKLDDKRFKELCDILVAVLERFNQHNKPSRLYTDYFDEILAKNISDEEMKSTRHWIQNEMKSEMVFDFEIEQQLHV